MQILKVIYNIAFFPTVKNFKSFKSSKSQLFSQLKNTSSLISIPFILFIIIINSFHCKSAQDNVKKYDGNKEISEESQHKETSIAEVPTPQKPKPAYEDELDYEEDVI